MCSIKTIAALYIIILASLITVMFHLYNESSRKLNLNDDYLKDAPPTFYDYGTETEFNIYTATNNAAAHPSNDVLKFDEFVLTNIRETYNGARSHTEWVQTNVDPFGDLGQFQTIPLHATVDRRPIIVRRQLMEDRKKSQSLAADGKLLGCAVTGATFVSNLGELDLEHYKEYAPTCDVCFQFSNREDMSNFVPSLGYEALKPGQQSIAVKCFEGEATVEARFAEWQQETPRFGGFGHQWQVDCALPNGVQDLTCREISRMQNKIDVSHFIVLIVLFFRSNAHNYTLRSRC